MFDEHAATEVLKKAPPPISKSARRDLVKLERSQRKLARAAAKLAPLALPSLDDIQETVARASALMQEHRTGAGPLLQSMAAEKASRARDCIVSKWSYQTTRDASFPNRFWTVFTSSALIVLEASATAAILAESGRVPLELAGALGLTVAGTANVAGTIGGLVGLRYAGYRKRPEIEAERPWHFLARRLGGAAVVSVCALTQGVLGFAAARLRTPGGDEALFDFVAAPLSSTLNSGMSLGLLAMSATFAAIALAKGRDGWLDPMPGFQEPFARLRKVDDEAANIADQAAERIDAAADDAIAYLDGLRTSLAKAHRRIRRLDARILAYNLRLDALRDRELAVNAARRAIERLLGVDRQPMRDELAAHLESRRLGDGAQKAAAITNTLGLIQRATTTIEEGRSAQLLGVEALLDSFIAGTGPTPADAVPLLTDF